MRKVAGWDREGMIGAEERLEEGRAGYNPRGIGR
jgi:hypothetical protein